MRLSGEVTPPGDKSISHRVVMLAALARGRSRCSGLNPGADVSSTLDVVRALGVPVGEHDDEVSIDGVGGAFRPPTRDLDCGNSGTTMRLMTGVLAGREGLDTRLIGDASLSGRPMERVAGPLRELGAAVETTNGHAPLAVSGRALTGKTIRTPVASAQVKSAVLLAGLTASGVTEVIEPARSRDHTERLLRRMGARIDTDSEGTIRVRPGDTLEPLRLRVPADPSAGAFYAVAASLVPGSEIRVRGVSMNPTRVGFLDVLTRMGAQIEVDAARNEAGEPAADLVVRAAPLRSTDIGPDEIPSLIDEVPILAIAAAQASGTTRIRGASELRVKECDRLRAMCEGLTRLGVVVSETEDGLDVTGREGEPFAGGASIDAEGDHRIAMSFRVASLVARDEISISGAEAVRISDPKFESALGRLVIG